MVSDQDPVEGQDTEDVVDLLQRQFLEELAATGSWSKACEALDIKSTRTPRRWYQKNPAFRALYEEIFGKDFLDLTKRQIEALTTKAVGVYDDVMTDARKVIKHRVQCPSCGERFETSVVIEDNMARLKAADSTMKVAGMLKEQKEVNVKGGITITQLSGAERVALVAYEAGRPLSPAMLARLRELGVIDDPRPQLPQGKVIEGEILG